MMPTVKFYKRISQILIVFFVNNLDVMLQVEAYSTGAPVHACDSMEPRHGAKANDTSPPYNISVSSNTYSPSQRINVTIESKPGHDFKGFLMAARPTGTTENVGFFIPIDGTKGLDCSNKVNSAITHANNDQRTTLTFRWEAPATDEGDIEMKATIVKSKVNFWLNVASEVMKPSSAPITKQPSSAPITSQTSLTTTKSPANEINCKSKGKCQIRWQMDKDAGVTKFDFSLESSNANMYIALGLSDDQKMGDDSVMECLRFPNSSILAQMSYNNAGYSNSLVPSDSITLTKTTFENGVMKCSFTRKNTVNNSNIYDLEGKEWYFLVAIGDVNINKPAEKNIHSIKFASEAKIDLSKNEGPQNIGEGSKGILISVHGSVMIFAWVFFANVGMFAARYSKSIDTKLNGVAIWFQLHRISMGSTLLLTVAGFICVFVAVGDYSGSMGLPYDAHPILGIIVTSLTLINPIMACFRPDKDSSKRPWFNWAHRCVGITAFILADATLFIGFFWFHHSVTIAKSGVMVLILFIIYKGIAILAMESVDCWRERSTGSVELSRSNGTARDVKVEKFGRIKEMLLGCHVIVTLTFSILLVIFLNLKDDHDQLNEHDNHDD